MSSAQRDLQHLDESAVETEAEAPFALREQVAERLAAHRARRSQHSPRQTAPAAAPSPAKGRAAAVAAAVAERYAQSQSYRAFLAAEAERAIRQAEAAAEVAALNAQAVADAQYKLLDELDQWSLTPPATPAAPTLVPNPAASIAQAEVQPASTLHQAAPASTTQQAAPALTVRLYEEVAPPRISEITATSGGAKDAILLDEDEAFSLDEEIAFRQSVNTFEPAVAPIEIPANLIEFPRQLVAPRKARPRLAEGPLREDSDTAAATTQLRIFEVEAAQISTAPAVESVEPEWSSILLSPQPAIRVELVTEPEFILAQRPQTAPLSLRLMAAMVDVCAVATSYLLFAAGFAFTIGNQPAQPAVTAPATNFIGRMIDHLASHMTGPMSLSMAVVTSVVVFAFLGLLYQILFFTLTESTPGMRYARIAFCTFSDDNPTRPAMRRRIFAVLLSACPLGLGFLWALLDEDGLGWHDRISRMYQRSY